MQAQANTSTTIHEVFIKSSLSQKISLTDWHKLNLALSEGCLTQEEQRLIRRILHSVRRGWFDILGEESVVTC